MSPERHPTSWEAPTVKKMINLLILNAIKDQIEQMHVTWREGEMSITYLDRDKALQEVKPPPKSLHAPLMEQIDSCGRKYTPDRGGLLIEVGRRTYRLDIRSVCQRSSLRVYHMTLQTQE